MGGSRGSPEPPGPLLTHLHTVYMAYSECRPTRLNPLAERTCFSQVRAIPCSVWHAPWYLANTVGSMPSEVRSAWDSC
jgi:hypothetical protein